MRPPAIVHREAAHRIAVRPARRLPVMSAASIASFRPSAAAITPALRRSAKGRVLDARYTPERSGCACETARQSRPAAIAIVIGSSSQLASDLDPTARSEEHTSELQSLMRLSY